MKKAKLAALALVAVFAMSATACASQTTDPPGDSTTAGEELAKTGSDVAAAGTHISEREETLADDGATLEEAEDGGFFIHYDDGATARLAAQYDPEWGMKGLEIGGGGDTAFTNLAMSQPGVDYHDVYYNTEILNADERGCQSCHVNIIATLYRYNPGHPNLSYGNAWPNIQSANNVQACVDCHTYNYDGGGLMPDFSEMIHGIHGTDQEAQKATCMNCHGVERTTGELKMWEEVKYDQMKNVHNATDERVSNEFNPKFEWNDDEVDDVDDMFNMTWFQSETGKMAEIAGLDINDYKSDYSRLDDFQYLDENEQLKEDIFNNWPIGVTGMVNEEKHWTLGELLEIAPSETRVMKNCCGMARLGGWANGNYEVTGIPLDWFLEQAGADPNYYCVDFESTENTYVDGETMNVFIGSVPKGWTDKWNVLLVYEINGKRLNWAQGFPLQAWVGATPADTYMKQVYNIMVNSEETQVGTDTCWTFHSSALTQSPAYGGHVANVGFYDVHEGQLVPGGQEFTIRGFSDALYEKVKAVEFSWDQGKTWTSYSLEGANPERLVHWYYTFTLPENETGAYVLNMRTIREDGTTAVNNFVKVMLNLDNDVPPVER